jgi:hypothetical protein
VCHAFMLQVARMLFGAMVWSLVLCGVYCKGGGNFGGRRSAVCAPSAQACILWEASRCKVPVVIRGFQGYLSWLPGRLLEEQFERYHSW